MPLMLAEFQIPEPVRLRRPDVVPHLVFWGLFFLYLIWDSYYDNTLEVILLQSVFYLLITGMLVYVNILWMVPNYLYTSRYPAYLGLFAMLILIGSTSRYYVNTFFVPIPETRQFPGIYLYFRRFFMTSFEVSAITALKILQDRFRARTDLRQMEKQKLETELKFLKAQMSPHFLFNTLNNIYFLIRKDPEKASDSVLKLSDILRFRLYGVKESRVQVEGEIKYILNYIELEQLRYEGRLTVTFKQEGEKIPFLVEPFFFLDFVENAFKHNSIMSEPSGWIRIGFAIATGRIDFTIENSCQIPDEEEENRPEEVMRTKEGGIGMPNIRKRLELLYPGKHELIITKKNHIFSVSLSLFP